MRSLALLLLAAALAPAQDLLVRAEALWKAGRYQEANDTFRAAAAADPRNPDIKVRWGRFFLERFQPADAEQLFQEALKLRADHPQALLGSALVAAERYDEQAVIFARGALDKAPNLLEARELLARLALEDGNFKLAAEEAEHARKIDPQSRGAEGVLASIAMLQDKQPSQPIRTSEAWALAGHIFVLNRRYTEGIEFYKRAIAANPNNWRARSQLGINLMRLGRNDEAREQLEAAYTAGFRDPGTVNSLRLMDSYKNFTARKTPTTVVVAHKKEADLVGPYVEAELKRAIATFDAKYKTKLPGPVQVELYPDHEDFAVRTLGMPGLGALGVTFGTVVAMDSPSGRKPGSFHWASTLWHELSHVYVLTATKHRVPRWFTEGMAVYEETATSPDWGDRLDPSVIDALTKKRLLPVAELDRGFIRPTYPAQVGVSYFQAGQICSYIAEKWSYDKLLAMMHAFGKGHSTPQVIEEQLAMKPAEFDTQFQAWLNAKTGKVVAAFPEWKRRMRELSEIAKAGKHDDVLAQGPAVRDLYPDYVEAGSAYELIAAAQEAKGNKDAARAELERYASTGGRSPETLRKLAAMYEQAGRRPDAIRTYQRLLYIYPMDEDVHRRIGELLLNEKQADRAAVAFTAALAAKPADPAASHFNLARALRAQNKLEDAKEQLLLALEIAPGFKPAQKMLLELSQ